MMKENEWESSGNESKYNTIIKRVTISGIKRHAGKKKQHLLAVMQKILELVK